MPNWLSAGQIRLWQKQFSMKGGLCHREHSDLEMKEMFPSPLAQIFVARRVGLTVERLGKGSSSQPPVTPSYGLNTLLTVPSEGCPGEPCFCDSLITPIFSNFPLDLIFFISRPPCSLWQRPPFQGNSPSSLRALRRAATFRLLLLLLWSWNHTFGG